MRIFKAGNGKWKIGKNGPAIYKTYSEAKNVYVVTKLNEIKKAWSRLMEKKRS
jgi:hypothetical protein